MTIEVTAPQPGVVVAHHVARGAIVAAGQALLTVETMKLERIIPAPGPGVAGALPPVGSVVAAGDVLTRVQPDRPAPPTPLTALGTALRSAPSGHFTELDLGADGLEPVERDGKPRTAGVVVGELSHQLPGHTGRVRRVWICGDSERNLGAVAEAECRLIIAAFDHAQEHGLPVEWVAVSSGARISMTSGTENMDWCAAVVRRILTFTQAGGQVIVIVAGINVGAQSYWNSVATMLGHCAGMLVMVADGSMVLTGPRALARSGGESAPGDQELGGYADVMGPNGQAHHVAADLTGAYQLVLKHHDLCSATGGQVVTRDRDGRDICAAPAGDNGHSVGAFLRSRDNPARKLPFAARPVMAALRDVDAPVLERWPDMAGAAGAIVWDTRIAGVSATLIGIESRPTPNQDLQGPDWWAGSTLYPMAAKKIARALTHASGRRPVVVLANLAGFDGSAWSLRQQQLEWGAEIARSVVNFAGRIVVVITGRFHGGAYVVFNKTLNPGVRMLALEGTRVSVIGGSSAAEVVLSREVRRQIDLRRREGQDRATAEAEALRSVAEEFDRVHSVGRAFETGSVDLVLPPERLRAQLATELRSAVSADVRTEIPSFAQLGG